MKPYDSSLVSHLFLAKRENNPNRAHIIVNTRQAKHFPSDPVKSLENFETLARKAAQDGRAEKPTVVIAFAETATAIGAVVAGAFHDCFFVTTTREKLPDWATAITFEESHSHAKQHYLCVRDEDIFRRAAQVVLVDDEYTTGSTALKLIKALDGCLAPDCRIYAASLAASAESLERFRDAGVTPVTLADTGNITNTAEPERISPDISAAQAGYVAAEELRAGPQTGRECGQLPCGVPQGVRAACGGIPRGRLRDCRDSRHGGILLSAAAAWQAAFR